VYFYGLINAAFLIVLTILAAMGLNRLREWREARGRRRRPQQDPPGNSGPAAGAN
jgi:hypothetical protein